MLELKHGLALLLVISLEFAMLGIRTGAKLRFSNCGTGDDNTDRVKLLMQLTKPFLDVG
jgi:hypothetical protein